MRKSLLVSPRRCPCQPLMLTHRCRLVPTPTQTDISTSRSSHAGSWLARSRRMPIFSSRGTAAGTTDLQKKHLANPDRAKKLEHEIIVHCKANTGIRVIDAIAVVFKDERMRLGIKMAR